MSDCYNYTEFCSPHTISTTLVVPNPGELAPDFTALTLSGEEIRFSQSIKQITVLEMGSMTCPISNSRRNAMTQLIPLFPECKFVVLYVREAHPGELIPHHGSIEDKSKRANELKTQLGENRTILVDDIDGTGHQLYGAMPNSIFAIGSDQRVIYRSDWNDVSATHKVLMKLSHDESIDGIKAYFKPVNPFIFFDTVKRAGKGSLGGFRGCWTQIFETHFKQNVREFLK